MVELVESPGTSEFRKDLESYLKAVQTGREFTLRHQGRPIATIAQPSKLPRAFKAAAHMMSFTEIRDSSSLLRRTMEKDQAIIITKRVRGPSTLAKRGRRRTILRDRMEVAAVWPLRGAAIVTAMLDFDRAQSKSIENLSEQVTALAAAIKPIAEKVEIIKGLDDEIAKKRTLIESLDKTIRRVAV